MTLTRTERWIISNQFHILEILSPKEAQHFANGREALECGYELEYEELCQNIYKEGDTLSNEACEEVINILDMFDNLKRCFDALPPKSGIEEGRVKFPGFDGNHETKQMAYARYFCDGRTPRFTDLPRANNFNSHMQSLPRYRSMLHEWERSTDKNNLTKDDILRIVSAK
jgi:uncharacterized protein YfbU (UPF0304 family)